MEANPPAPSSLQMTQPRRHRDCGLEMGPEPECLLLPTKLFLKLWPNVYCWFKSFNLGELLTAGGKMQVCPSGGDFMPHEWAAMGCNLWLGSSSFGPSLHLLSHHLSSSHRAPPDPDLGRGGDGHTGARRCQTEPDSQPCSLSAGSLGQVPLLICASVSPPIK